jgi:hypothetical protein
MTRLLSKSTLLAALLLLMAGAASAQSVTIAWDPNKEADLAGYVVHYGTASGVYTHSLDVGKVTSANIVSLTTGKTYFFAVQAYSTKALMSPMSAELARRRYRRRRHRRLRHRHHRRLCSRRRSS